MGAVFSGDFPPDEACTTPDSRHRRPAGDRLVEDPRSPTCGIDRTPIVAAPPACTAADPRSPTVGIPRTPISIFANTNSSTSVDTETISAETIVDPRSPTAGIARTPIDALQLLKLTDRTELVQDRLPKYELDDADDDVGGEVVQRHVPGTTDTGGCGQTCNVAPELTMPKPIAASADMVSQLPSSSIKMSTVAKSSPRGSAAIFIDDANAAGSHIPTRSMAAVAAASPRSAPTLRNADVNSPRRIVQQKQLQKAGLLKQAANMHSPSPQLPALRQAVQPAQDKENKRD